MRLQSSFTGSSVVGTTVSGVGVFVSGAGVTLHALTKRDSSVIRDKINTNQVRFIYDTPSVFSKSEVKYSGYAICRYGRPIAQPSFMVLKPGLLSSRAMNHRMAQLDLRFPIMCLLPAIKPFADSGERGILECCDG